MPWKQNESLRSHAVTRLQESEAPSQFRVFWRPPISLLRFGFDLSSMAVNSTNSWAAPVAHSPASTTFVSHSCGTQPADHSSPLAVVGTSRRQASCSVDSKQVVASHRRGGARVPIPEQNKKREQGGIVVHAANGTRRVIFRECRKQMREIEKWSCWLKEKI
jgi:hypothetical protein